MRQFSEILEIRAAYNFFPVAANFNYAFKDNMVPSAGMSMGQLQRGGGGAPLRRHLHYILILASVMPVSLKSTYSRIKQTDLQKFLYSFSLSHRARAKCGCGI